MLKEIGRGELGKRHPLPRRLYKRSEIAGALRRAGFRVRILSGYGQMRFDKGLVGYLARKM